MSASSLNRRSATRTIAAKKSTGAEKARNLDAVPAQPQTILSMCNRYSARKLYLCPMVGMNYGGNDG